MHPVLFKVGPVTIYTYGFFVFLGVIAGYLVCSRQAKREGLSRDKFADIFFWTILFSFLGAKLLYIIIEFKYFLKDPLSVIRSGFVFYGGLISGLIVLRVLSRRQHIKPFKLLDIFCLGIPLAHAFGRLGCFFYGCCWGRTTDSFIGVVFPLGSPAGADGLKVIPTQLISAAFLFLLFFLILAISRHKKFDGQLFLTYILVYIPFRFVIEFFRGDPRGTMFLLPTSQFLSIVLVNICLLLWYLHRKASP